MVEGAWRLNSMPPVCPVSCTGYFTFTWLNGNFRVSSRHSFDNLCRRPRIYRLKLYVSIIHQTEIRLCPCTTSIASWQDTGTYRAGQDEGGNDER